MSPGRGPGAARRAAGPRLLTALAVLLSLLLLYEILRANQPDRLTVRLLGAPTTAVLLALTLMAAAFRQQQARLAAPSLRYIGRWVAEPERLLTPCETYWQVHLGNAGPGVALISHTSWRIAAAGGDSADTEVSSVTELHRRLAELRFIDGTDYWIASYSVGMAFSPDEERCYFECTRALVEAVAELTATITYESVLGDQDEKVVSLTPRPGASSVVSGGGGSAPPA